MIADNHRLWLRNVRCMVHMDGERNKVPRATLHDHLVKLKQQMQSPRTKELLTSRAGFEVIGSGGVG